MLWGSNSVSKIDKKSRWKKNAQSEVKKGRVGTLPLSAKSATGPEKPPGRGRGGVG